MGPLATWAIVSPDLHWREWDDVYVVYHERSGDTHHLNSTGAAVLRLLSEGPLSASAILGRLGDAPGIAPTELSAAQALLPALLEHLRSLGLIDTVPSDGHSADTRPI